MKESAERLRIRQEQFLCRCGQSLTYEARPVKGNEGGEFRVICTRHGESSYFIIFGHDEPTQWCSTREEAEQLWRVLQVMAGD